MHNSNPHLILKVIVPVDGMIRILRVIVPVEGSIRHICIFSLLCVKYNSPHVIFRVIVPEQGMIRILRVIVPGVDTHPEVVRLMECYAQSLVFPSQLE